jgi:hypothetical protein
MGGFRVAGPGGKKRQLASIRYYKRLLGLSTISRVLVVAGYVRYSAGSPEAVLGATDWRWDKGGAA